MYIQLYSLSICFHDQTGDQDNYILLMQENTDQYHINIYTISYMCDSFHFKNTAMLFIRFF